MLNPACAYSLLQAHSRCSNLKTPKIKTDCCSSLCGTPVPYSGGRRFESRLEDRKTWLFVAFLSFPILLLEYYFGRYYDCILPCNFIECRGGIFSISKRLVFESRPTKRLPSHYRDVVVTLYVSKDSFSTSFPAHHLQSCYALNEGMYCPLSITWSLTAQGWRDKLVRGEAQRMQLQPFSVRFKYFFVKLAGLCRLF